MEFVHGTTELGNGRAGSERSFSSEDRNRFTLRDDRLIHSRIHGEFTGTQTWEAPFSGTHVWDQVILRDQVILVGNRAPFCRDSRRFSGPGVRTMA